MRVSQKKCKVWITKYALTKGIISTTAEIVDNLAKVRIDGKELMFEIGRSAHYNQFAAINAARMLRDKKIARLQRQLDDLEVMKFEVCGEL